MIMGWGGGVELKMRVGVVGLIPNANRDVIDERFSTKSQISSV